MEFVQITKDGIEGTATVPETALPHWEGHGWRKVVETPAVVDASPESPPQVPTAQPRTSRRIGAVPDTTEE